MTPTITADAPTFISPLMKKLHPTQPYRHDTIGVFLDALDAPALPAFDAKLSRARQALAAFEAEHAEAAKRADAPQPTAREQFQARAAGKPMALTDQSALTAERDHAAALVKAGRTEIGVIERHRAAAIQAERAARIAAMNLEDARCFAAERIRVMLVEQRPGATTAVAGQLDAIEARAKALEGERRAAADANTLAQRAKGEHGRRYQRGSNPRTGETYEQLCADADAAARSCQELQYEKRTLETRHERLREELRFAIASTFEHIVRFTGVEVEPGNAPRDVRSLDEQLARFTRRNLPLRPRAGVPETVLLNAAKPLLAIVSRRMPEGASESALATQALGTWSNANPLASQTFAQRDQLAAAEAVKAARKDPD